MGATITSSTAACRSLRVKIYSDILYILPYRNKKSRTKNLANLDARAEEEKGRCFGSLGTQPKEGGARPGLPCVPTPRSPDSPPSRSTEGSSSSPSQSNPPPPRRQPAPLDPAPNFGSAAGISDQIREFAAANRIRTQGRGRTTTVGLTFAPRGASRGVDAASTGPWIDEPSGVTPTTAGAVRAWPRPRPRSPERPRHPRPRRPTRRPTQASARRCCRPRRGSGRMAAPRARASPSGPSAACSGRTPTARSSPRSSSSSPVIQVTRMMNTWILAYAQSCKYRRAGSPVQLAQAESTMIV